MLWKTDPDVFAIASDHFLNGLPIPVPDLNADGEIANFVLGKAAL